MSAPESRDATYIGLVQTHISAQVRAKTLEGVIREVQRMVTSENCPEILRIQVPIALVPQIEALMQQTCGDERESLRTSADIPANDGTGKHCAQHV